MNKLKTYRPSLLAIFGIEFLYSMLWIQLGCPLLSCLYGMSPILDEAIYHIVGAGMMNGTLPYRELFDHKGPLTYLIFGLGALVTPHSLIATGFILSFFLGATLLYAQRIFHLYFPLLPSLLLSFICPLFLTAWSGQPAEIGLPCFTITLFYFLRYWKKPQSGIPWFMLGCCVSCLLLLKFNLTAFWIPILATLCLHQLVHRGWLAGIAAFTKTSLGIIVTLLPFLAYFAYHEQGLSSLWESYVLFSVNYADQAPPIWQTNPISLCRGFFAASIFHPLTPLAEYAQAAMGTIAILTGMVALLFPSFRKLLFPSAAGYGVSALILSFVFLFAASFSGPFNWSGYYLVFIPFYILTMICLGVVIRALFNKKATIFILIGFIFATLVAYIYQARKHLNKNNREPDIVRFIRERSDAPLIICSSTPALYLHSDKSPAIRKFYHPPVKNFGQKQDIIDALNEKKCVYFIYEERQGEQISKEILNALDKHYQILSSGEVPPHYVIYKVNAK